VCKIGESKFVLVPALNQSKREGDVDKGQTFTIQVRGDAKSPGLIGSFSSPDSQYQNARARSSAEVWVRFRLAGHEYLTASQ
jgi:hypothetical protein